MQKSTSLKSEPSSEPLLVTGKPQPGTRSRAGRSWAQRSRPESGLDCLMCGAFARQRTATGMLKPKPGMHSRAGRSWAQHFRGAGGASRRQLGTMLNAFPLSHIMHLLISFRKSAPPQNCQLVVNYN
jgi:hypothetical protein